ncbi:hypothetical protein L9F63_002525 [Diploptera punctata]|uniref:ZFYVE26-like TPR repeats domain-containing protein n=1 Tax=Diploptera punctata TaxID=6984 RepID=A0AAD7ZSD7_DIPPU|nr:hypothetical protein L9F63_002525 [Diploptera punctata]
MMTVLKTSEQQQHWDLMWKPHLLLEQYIMNTRLEVLERMVLEVKPLLLDLPPDSPLSINSIDSMLRTYAGKALDFRVIQKSTFPFEEKLCVSLSVASQQSQEFIIPSIAPSKQDWVPNESVVGYGSVPVRVCDNCYQHLQTNEDVYMNQRMDENLPPFSMNSDESLNPDLLWKLTADETHNATVREEFSFEYAPSVSLCLAILKLHSEHVAHPRFLLDACDRMLQLLQPVGPGTANPEVDYSLVIRMVRSLAIAAKVRHARAGHISGVEQCDQLLSQIDLFNMLVQNRCSALIPAEFLNAHALRRLRDCLVEEEQWLLARDVSLKAGLDSNIVWAAWGKALLKTGHWDEAWNKFIHCFNKRPDTVQPSQNPLLLNEIIQILEESSYITDVKFVEKIEERKNKRNSMQSIQAESVIQGLASLKEICQGMYPQATPLVNAVVIGPKMNHVFYNECCRYLTAYGSNAGIISFYLHHDDLNAALKHVITKEVDKEIFFDVLYIPCLREGLITDLYQALSSFDASFKLWEKYFDFVCKKLEKECMWNVLYQLQLYLKDYMRATMSCIKFYRMGARNYTDLYLNLKHLKSAGQHLNDGLAAVRRRNSNSGYRSDVVPNLAMPLNERKLRHYLKMVELQETVSLFLYECEKEQLKVLQLLPELQLDSSKQLPHKVPTLLGDILECMQIAVLVLICGKSVAEGYHISTRIIDCFKLKSSDVFMTAARKLAHDRRYPDIKQLVECIRNSSDISNADCLTDDILVNCLKLLANKKESGDLESLVKLINATDKRIEGYINCQLLKAAYLLAVKSKRIADVEKILQEARRLGQTQVERLCLQRLEQKEQS